MKKFAAIAIIIVLGAVSFTSCKSHEKCPAYSKVEKSPKAVI